MLRNYEDNSQAVLPLEAFAEQCWIEAPVEKRTAANDQKIDGGVEIERWRRRSARRQRRQR